MWTAHELMIHEHKFIHKFIRLKKCGRHIINMSVYVLSFKLEKMKYFEYYFNQIFEFTVCILLKNGFHPSFTCNMQILLPLPSLSALSPV